MRGIRSAALAGCIFLALAVVGGAAAEGGPGKPGGNGPVAKLAAAVKACQAQGLKPGTDDFRQCRKTQLGVGDGSKTPTGPAAKLVGVSQRRTRAGARFQCMVHHRWAPAVLLELLRDPKPKVTDLAPVAVLPAEVATQLPAALVAAL